MGNQLDAQLHDIPDYEAQETARPDVEVAAVDLTLCRQPHQVFSIIGLSRLAAGGHEHLVRDTFNAGAAHRAEWLGGASGRGLGCYMGVRPAPRDRCTP